MSKKKGKIIEVVIEKSEDGTYWGTTQNIPGVISTFGQTLEELKVTLRTAFSDYLETATDSGETWIEDLKGPISWDYKMNLSSFFHLIPEVKISALGKKAKINESLMRQYVSGKANASEERLQLIQNAVHELGEELQSVSF